MSVFVDSAIIAEVQEAAKWGWIAGATTNPSLLAQSPLPPRETLQKIAEVLDGLIFYQLTAPTFKEMMHEAAEAESILHNKLVLKIPATSLGFQAAAHLSAEHCCAITTIFSPVQALLAVACKARYAIYYHSRAKQWLADGAELGTQLIHLLAGCETTEVLAASFKSKQDVLEAAQAGVKHLTIKFALLKGLGEDEFTQQAIAEFNATGRGILQQ